MNDKCGGWLAAEVELMRNSGWDLSAPYLGMIAFLVGGAVAATVALLCAVEEDRRMHERVRSFAEEAWRRTSDTLNGLTQQGRRLRGEQRGLLARIHENTIEIGSSCSG